MRTKIVATIGPASDLPEILYKMILAGMDVARMNFSHASEEWYAMARKNVLVAAKKAKRKVLIMQGHPRPAYPRWRDAAGGQRVSKSAIRFFSRPRRTTLRRSL